MQQAMLDLRALLIENCRYIYRTKSHNVLGLKALRQKADACQQHLTSGSPEEQRFKTLTRQLKSHPKHHDAYHTLNALMDIKNSLERLMENQQLTN